MYESRLPEIEATAVLFVGIITMRRANVGTIHIDDVQLEETGQLELDRWNQPVPMDRLLPVKHKFNRPDSAGVAKRFEAHHVASETRYRGNGTWESRDTLSGKPGGDKPPPAGHKFS